MADTVSGGLVDMGRGLVSSLYNPYAGVPSMHIGYAIVVGAALVRYCPSPLVRRTPALYPLFVLLVVIGTRGREPSVHRDSSRVPGRDEDGRARDRIDRAAA